MTIGQRVLIEVADVVDVGDTTLAQKQTVRGANFPFAARVFGLERRQYAYYSFVASDLATTSILAKLYWTSSAAAGSVGWIVSAATLSATTTARVIDKGFAADNGTATTNVLGSWRYHETSYLINNDAYAAGNHITIRVTRDITNKTAAADVYLIGAAVQYTGQ